MFRRRRRAGRRLFFSADVAVSRIGPPLARGCFSPACRFAVNGFVDTTGERFSGDGVRDSAGEGIQMIHIPFRADFGEFEHDPMTLSDRLFRRRPIRVLFHCRNRICGC